MCESCKTETRPLERKPTVSFEKLLDAAALGTTEVAAIESLAGRLIRLEQPLHFLEHKVYVREQTSNMKATPEQPERIFARFYR